MKRKHRTTAKFIFVLITVSYCLLMQRSLQAQNATTNKEKLKPLTSWVGKWEGEGWSIDQTRQRTEFTVKESIAMKINGSAILAEGTGTNKSDGKVGFQSLGIIYYNNEAQRYEIKSLLADGNLTLATADFNQAGQFVWGFDVPGGKVQYTITLKDDTWQEKGEFVTPAGQAFPIMEMKLKKVN